ncbi:F-box/kelch-repeat protein [Cardamine amara subsp. amara]|uniref:F-box/kelch-repeat protein n=1 Tax=Cardamine amara subsp. amara TaxID=228776 RepID=A0ABD0Z742_CARAN
MKKKKMTTTTMKMPESFPITSLPDELMLSCLARVSRLYYPSLSLVCKSFKSLLASPELYKTRSLLQRTESCLYVCLHFPPDPYPHWFTLRHKPNQTLTSKNMKQSSGNVLVPIPSLRSPLEKYSCLVALGSNIYSIAEPIKLKASSSVSILDCGSHKWRKAPSLMVKRLRPCAS